MVLLVIFATHCVAAAALIVIISLQLKCLSPTLTLAQLARLLKIDVSYSWAALITLVSGLMLWLIRHDAPGNLLVNPWFTSKLALFAVTALLSVYPSMTYLSLKRGGLSARMPVANSVVWAVRIQLVLLVSLLVLALVPRWL